MTASTSSVVYIHVVEDVIEKVREEFVADGGPSEKVLQELQEIWELKMMQADSVLQPSERPIVAKPGLGAAITPVHDLNLNVPYKGTEEYETPTTEMLFPPTMVHLGQMQGSCSLFAILNLHAIAYVEGDKYYGAKATINVWEPKIQQPNEFSLSQVWILGGSFGEELNSIEVGWQDFCPRTAPYDVDELNVVREQWAQYFRSKYLLNA